MIEIDGSMGEGGGQVLRSAVALSAMTGKDCMISSIRSGRPKPGLAAQHLVGLRGIRDLCGADLKGDEVGSEEIVFKPGKLSCRDLEMDVGTAGSITLVLQACLLPLVVNGGRSRLTIRGGTDVRWSPPADHMRYVLLPLLERMGISYKMEVLSRGFFPEGGGEVVLEISSPDRLEPLELDKRGELDSMTGSCFSQNLPDHVTKRMVSSARKKLVGFGEPRIDMKRSEGPSTGVGICLFARYGNTVLGANGLGERGVPSEKVGGEAAEALIEEMNCEGTLDVHTADQLLPYMALAGGSSIFKVRKMSGHLRTQMDLVPLFLDTEFQVMIGDTV